MDSHAPCLCLVACCTLSATGHGRLAAEVVGGHPRIAASGAARPSSAGVVIVSVPAHRPRRSGMVARGRSPPRRAVARRGGGRIGRVCLGWLLRASSPRARAALVHVWVAVASPVLRCFVRCGGAFLPHFRAVPSGARPFRSRSYRLRIAPPSPRLAVRRRSSGANSSRLRHKAPLRSRLPRPCVVAVGASLHQSVRRQLPRKTAIPPQGSVGAPQDRTSTSVPAALAALAVPPLLQSVRRRGPR